MGLLEVQKHALAAAHGKPGFAYYMEMGLGKTLTALVEFTSLVETREATRLVVVCPNSFKTGWVDEINKHKIEVDAFIFESGADGFNEAFLKTKFTKPPVLIINYEAIRNDNVKKYISRFVGVKDCMIVLYESIQIKTYDR